MKMIKYALMGFVFLFSGSVFADAHLKTPGEYRALAITALERNTRMYEEVYDRLGRLLQGRKETTAEFNRVHGGAVIFLARSWRKNDEAIQMLTDGAPFTEVIDVMLTVPEGQESMVIYGHGWNGIHAPESALAQIHMATVYLFELVNCNWQKLPNCDPVAESPNGLTPNEQEMIYAAGQFLANIWLQHDKAVWLIERGIWAEHQEDHEIEALTGNQ